VLNTGEPVPELFALEQIVTLLTCNPEEKNPPQSSQDLQGPKARLVDMMGLYRDANGPPRPFLVYRGEGHIWIQINPYHPRMGTTGNYDRYFLLLYYNLDLN
jgi:hypothetical protein